MALLLTAAVAAALLAGCSSGEKEEKTETTPAVSSGSGSGSAVAEFETQTWKFATSGTENSNWMMAAKYFGDLVNKETNGAVTIEYYPSDQLTDGNQSDGVQALIEGDVDISLHSNLIYASFDPRFNVVSLPFLFDSTEDADAKLQDGDGGKELKNILEENGLHCMGIGENGFRNVTNSQHEIATLADMKGLKMRVAASALMNRTYELWGAVPENANWPEVYTSLKTGKFDGQENPLPIANASSIQDTQKYLTYWNATYDCLFFCMNKDLYDSLSSDLRSIVDECGQKAMEYQRQTNREEDAQILADWQSKGIVVTRPTAEALQQFKDAAQPCWSEFEDELTPKLVSAFTGK